MKSVLMVGAVLFASIPGSHAADFVKGEIVVKYRDGFRPTRDQMNLFYDDVGVERVQRMPGIAAGIERLKISSNVKIQDAIASALRNPQVEYAQPNFILTVQPVQEMGEHRSTRARGNIFAGWPGDTGPDQPPTPVKDPDLLPAPDAVNPPVVDPQLADLYGMEKIGAMEAWKTHKGDHKIVVAVIDTGIDYNHEDLAANVWRGQDAQSGSVIVGYDFVHNDVLPFDDHAHGTHVSGTIGGVGNNGKGVAGVNHVVSIMGLKFLSSEGGGTTTDAIRAIDFAAEHGAKVVNASWGGPSESAAENQALFDAIDRAGKKDVLFVAAAGNSGVDNDGTSGSVPARFTNANLIAVAATDRNDTLAPFSNYGAKTVHLAAPGVKIMSSTPGNHYKAFDGTSMATPHVVGAAALVWSKHPTWTYAQVKDALLKSVDALPALLPKTITGGRLNVLKALSL